MTISPETIREVSFCLKDALLYRQQKVIESDKKETQHYWENEADKAARLIVQIESATEKPSKKSTGVDPSGKL